ncbi:MAG TPA: methyltransferase domain-containing protein, partial [Vicinamibacterales bacterium]|nr:methyltransferase domain-containing protein [Vicinamibacterales bacterium]
MPVRAAGSDYICDACPRRFPLVCGVPDFRLVADPYIGFDDDRKKAAHLFEAGRGRTFEDLVRHYYSITPEDPPDLAAQWTRHHLAEVAIAGHLLRTAGLSGGRGRVLLDLGCSTGGLVIAAAQANWQAVGIDVALRWLVIGAKRLDEAGLPITLVCANAEHLPFPDRSVDAVTGNDLLEHTSHPAAVLQEASRVAREQGAAVFTANNRFAPLPEPQLRLWGVAQMPRRWQAAYVAWRRPDVHPYRLRLPSATELGKLMRGANFGEVSVEAAPLFAPHWPEGAA